MNRTRATAATVAALLFVAFTLLSGRLPAFSVRADVIVSMAIGVALVGVIVGVVVAARPSPRQMLVLAAGGFVCAVAGSALGVVPVADLGKIAFGAGVGYWLGSSLAELTNDLRIIVVLALAAGAFDALSVFVPQGPTHLLLTKAPQTLPYFLVVFPTIGYAVRDAYSGLGTSDVLFFGLYLAAAVGYRLRVRLTLAAMTASFVVTVTVALWWRALPALPLLSLAFLGVNADLIARRWTPPARDDSPTPP